jgi:two-component system, OmpR family, sensor histidine kinase KdpD
VALPSEVVPGKGKFSQNPNTLAITLKTKGRGLARDVRSLLRTGKADTGVLARYLGGVGVSVICTGIAYPLYPYFDPVNIVMLYLLGATVAGLRLGRGPAALTAMANAAAFDFFFVPPRYSFYVSETQYLFTLGVMLSVTFVIANLMVSVRRQTEAAAERGQRTEMLYAMSRELIVAADAPTIADVAARHVSTFLKTRAVVLLPDEQDALPAPARGGYCAQLVCGDRTLGVLVLQLEEGQPLPAEQRTLLEALTGQITLALERARLAEVAAASRAAAERAALRNTLLASISHDLRGPLSAIAGAGSLVAQHNLSLDRHRRKTLGHLIEEKARDMSGLLTNVLDLMRLETNAGVLQAQSQALDELAGIAIRNLEHRFGSRQVSTAIPMEFPSVLVDGQLVVQLLSNLLENAIKHTPERTSIAIRAAVRDGRAVVTVEDDGPGFGGRNPETLFEKFERGQKESHVSGVGLGLAICRAIVRLHGGEIRASNRAEGGARFELTLPLEPEETEVAEIAL